MRRLWSSDGVAGSGEVSTEKVWQFAEDMKLPCIFVVNKLDRERSSFERAMTSINERFGRAAVPVQLPLGEEKRILHWALSTLIRMNSYCYKSDGDGKGKEGDIPTPQQEAANVGHEALVEMVAEGNDELMEEFFNTSTLPVEHIVSGLKEAVKNRRIFPVLCLSAAHNIGTDLALALINELLPSPAEGRLMQASENGKEIEKPITPSGASSLFVFKTSADHFYRRARVTFSAKSSQDNSKTMRIWTTRGRT